MVTKKVVWIVGGLIIVAAAIATVIVLLTLPEKDAEIDPIEETFVETKLGKINGSIFYTRLDKKFIGFRGIRYAEAPVDNLRFQVSNIA